VVGGPAGQRHGLVEQRHALVEPARLHVGQPGVGQRLRLEIDIAEPPGPVEGKLGGRQQLGGIVDVASQARDRHPALLHAGRLVLNEPPSPSKPGSARSEVPQHDGEDVAQPDAGHRRPAWFARRSEVADRGRQVGDHRVDVEPSDGLVGPIERSQRLVHTRHGISIAPGRR